MPRRVEVEITGDSSQLEQSFRDSEDAAIQFDRRMQRTLTGLAKLAGGAYAVGQGLEAAGQISEQLTGKNSELTHGLNDASKAAEAFARGDLGGVLEAALAPAKRTTEAVEKYVGTLKDASQETDALRIAQGLQALGYDDLAKKVRTQIQLTKSLEFQQRKYNETIVDGVNVMVPFKGIPDEGTTRLSPGAIRGINVLRGGPITVNTTVNLDGKVLARSTKRVLQRDEIHDPPQRRGPNAGRR